MTTCAKITKGFLIICCLLRNYYMYNCNLIITNYTDLRNRYVIVYCLLADVMSN